MQLIKLFESEKDRAVSPVIGVILMVAITVILAAVIGAFVIGIGGEQDNAPTASIDFSQDTDRVTINHESGQDLNINEITFSGDVDFDHANYNQFDSDDSIDNVAGIWSGGDEQITAGDNIELTTTTGATNVTSSPWPLLESDGTINVVWESSDTDTSTILADYDYDIEDYDDW